MTNGGQQGFSNPKAFVSPGDLEAISAVYAAHGRSNAPAGSYVAALNDYFDELGQKPTDGANYEPRKVRNAADPDAPTRQMSPAAMALEYSTLCQLQRQLYRAMYEAEEAGDTTRKNALDSKLRGIEQRLGYGSLGDDEDENSNPPYLAELLYLDSDFEQYRKNGGGAGAQVEHDILEFREGIKEAEEKLATQASELADAIFATRDMSGTAVTKLKASLQGGATSPDELIPEHEVTNAIGLYPFERQVDVIDSFTRRLEKHGEGSAILVEMLRTGVPFDPLALFDVAINHGQEELAFNAPKALTKHNGDWTYVSWEFATSSGKVWKTRGPIIKDPLGSGASTAVSNTFEKVEDQYQMTGKQKKYRIDPTTGVGTKLATIASRFVAAVTAVMRGYQHRRSLSSDEKARVEEFQGYLAVITTAFIDPEKVNDQLPGTADVEALGGKIPKTTAARSGSAGPRRSGRATFKQNTPTQQTLKSFQDTLAVVSQLQGNMGAIVSAQFDEVSKEIEGHAQSGNLEIPEGTSMEAFITENDDWRTRNNALVGYYRAFTAINLLCSTLQVGFSAVDTARYGQGEYDTGEAIGAFTGQWATLGSIASDVDTLFASYVDGYDTHVFVQKGLAEAGGYVADAVDVVLTIEDTAVGSYNSMAIGNTGQAIEQTTTAVLHVGSLAAGYAIGNLPGAVVAAVLDIVGTYIIDALFEDLSTIEQWTRATIFGTGFDDIQVPWDVFGAATPATATPDVNVETESDTGEGLTFFKWDVSATRHLVGYYNLTMGFDLEYMIFGPPAPKKNSDPDPELTIGLCDISFGKTDGQVAICPVRKRGEDDFVVDPAYITLPMKSGSHSVEVNPAGLYGMGTGTVQFDCSTNAGAIASNQSKPSGEWVDDVWAFKAETTHTGSDRPLFWPPADAGPTEGELWGFEVVHLMSSLPTQASSNLSDKFAYSRKDAIDAIENVPHPRCWDAPAGLDEYPPRPTVSTDLDAL